MQVHKRAGAFAEASPLGTHVRGCPLAIYGRRVEQLGFNYAPGVAGRRARRRHTTNIGLDQLLGSCVCQDVRPNRLGHLGFAFP